jgi:hypothetical protein
MIDRFSAPLHGNRWILAHDATPTSIVFGVTHDEEFNAFAFLSANQHCIAFNHSVFPTLLQVFCELTAQATFLPMIGNSTVTSFPALKTVSKSTTGDLLWEGMVLPKLLPQDPERLQYTFILYRLALEFLFFHELHHVLGGHISYIGNQYAMSALLEIRQRDPLSFKDRRCMEWAADFFAAKSLADSCLSRRFMTINPSQIPNTPEFTETIFYLALIAVTVLFCVFEIWEGTPDDNYPTVLTRYSTVVDMFSRPLEHENRTLWERWEYVAGSALGDLRVAIRQTQWGRNLLTQIDSDEFLDQAWREMNMLAEQSLQLMPSWQRYALITGGYQE